MPNSKTVRKAALSGIGAALLAVGSSAFAHTTILSQATEGTTADNALKIGHGCTTPAGFMIPVIAQSVVFPTDSPVVTASDGSAVANLSDVIVQGSVAGLLSPIQSRDIFQSQQLKGDALGNKIGWSSTRGSLTPFFVGRVPFQFAPPNFVATSCAKRLLIKVAIADICVREIGGGLDEGKLNLWVPDNGSHYAAAAAANNIDGLGAPATLTVNRNLAANPLPSGCGAGIDVTVTPSAADVDAHLPIPGYWE